MERMIKVNHKWYNFETIFPTVAEKLHDFLTEHDFPHEISAAGDYYHFEIALDNDDEKKIVDEYLLT